MRASNERLTILSDAEQAALYEIPDFDDVQRLNYINLTSDEQALMRGRANLAAQVHCAIQIGYFKAKHLFFSFDWDEAEVQDDINFVMQEYFPRTLVFTHLPSQNINIMLNAMQLLHILVIGCGQKNLSLY